MAKQRRPRRSVPSPDPGDEVATLHMLYLRADYLRKLWIELSREGNQTLGVEAAAADLSAGYALPLWVCVTMHLASLYTVVEGWRRLGLRNPRVDAALSVPGREASLRSLRDGVFHYGALNNASILALLANADLLAWARELHSAFGVYLDGAHAAGAT